MPRLVVDTCADAGLAFNYGERITEGWERLTDNEWEQEIAGGFPDVGWMGSVLAE
jgi:hypothetical protein